MTNIKDVVTVTVDNAFRLFPIDKERYELFVYICGMRALASNQDAPVSLPSGIEDDRIRSFLSATRSNFRLGALSIVRYHRSAITALSPIVVDRAWRYAQLLSQRSVADALCDGTSEVAVRRIEIALWGSLARAVGDLVQPTESNLDMELQS
jgi:hypothetical protein